MGPMNRREALAAVSALLGGIRQVRAHFYASYHSSRRESNPISREVLRELTSVPERTQREYEQAADVACQRNIAVGGSEAPRGRCASEEASGE